MKKVLIIAQHFWPCSLVSANRVSFFARYLCQFNWRPLIVTTDEGGAPHVESAFPESDIFRVPDSVPRPALNCGKLWRFRWDVVGQPEKSSGFHIMWRKFVPTAERVAAEERPNAIFCTVGPEICAFIGHRLKSRTGLPFVIDFRDIVQQYPPPRNAILRRRRKLLVKRMAWCVKAADSVVTVSEGLAGHLHDIYSCTPNVISNGYDEALHDQVAVPQARKFTITYTGSLAFGRSRRLQVERLYAAIDLLLDEGVECSSWTLLFVGVERSHLQNLRRYRAFSMTRCLDRVSYRESLDYQHASTILLHFSHPEHKGIVTSKIFDYLAAGRPILSIPGDHDCVDALLLQTGAGVSKSSPREIADQLLCWYREWTSARMVTYCGSRERISEYSRRTQAGQLAAVLDHVAKGRNYDSCVSS